MDQDDITTMFEETNVVLEANKALWTAIPAFADAVSRAEAGTGTIRGRQGEQVPSGDTDAKTAARIDLEAHALLIADQVAVLAAKTADFDLAAKVDVNKSRLDRFADSDLLTACRQIAAGAAAHAAVLASDYGVSAAELSALDAAITKFDGMKTAPRNATVSRKVATLALPEAIAQVRSIYCNEIDKLMTRFQKSQPDFYAAYQSARIIVNRAATHKKPAAPVPPAPK